MTSPTLPSREHHMGGVPAHAARTITDAVGGPGLQGEFDRPLTQGELLELAATIAADPETWRRHVAFSRTDDEGRHYVNIRRDDNVDVWVLCWTSSNDTGWHDHDISSGAVAVVQGRLLEHNLGVGRPEVVTDVEAGQIYSFGPDHIHRLTGSPGVEGGSVSIHVYSPPLVTMGQYVVDDDGVLHRTSVSYADELKYTGQVPA